MFPYVSFPYLEMSPECYFFRLPAELKLQVISYLDQKRDLYNISQTCQWLEVVALQTLYRNVDLEIPAAKSSAWSTGAYLRLRSHVVKAVQEVTLRDGLTNYTGGQYSKRRKSNAGSPEGYLIQLLEKIPNNKLSSLFFMHRSPITRRALDSINARHGRSLRHLACYDVQIPHITPTALPQNLLSFEARSMENAETLGRIVHANRNTIESLRLGEEKELVENYRIHKTAFWESIPRSLDGFAKTATITELPHLRKLALSGVDLRSVTPLHIESAMYLTNLDELSLESCVGCAEFLTATASIFTFAQSQACSEPHPPVLHSFSLRHEASSAALKDALLQFLTSFTGLRILSLLFENGSMSLRLAELAGHHGPTLEQLVLETRIQPRELLRLDTSRPFGMGGYSQQLWEEGTDDVCRLCPNLRELSIGFPWNDEMVRIRRSPLPTLKYLHTMHVRNFPESSTLLHMGDYTIKEYAIKFVEWTFGNLVGGDKPALETLSIGPTLYESRFVGANASRKKPPEFLRTHHFMVDWAQTRFKRWSAMVTPVSEKYMEEMREEKPLGGVFQQVWLR